MKKITVLILTAALLIVLGMSAALASPEEWQGKTLPDFTTSTIDGKSFTLSESLKTHDLVLINLWATWCGPCRMEFPFLETAWQQYSARVDVIALSIEASDTFDVLRSFANEYGLHFPIGRDESDLFGMMDGYAIPTTLIVDREMRIIAVEIGSKSSVEEFTALFDSLLSAYPEQAASEAAERCVLCFRDPNGNPIQGVTVGFCNGEYDPIETDSNGRVSFAGDPNEYHIHLLGVPSGYSIPWEQIYVCGDHFELTVTLYPD